MARTSDRHVGPWVPASRGYNAGMSIRIYNTLTRRLEELEPLVPGEVSLYVCGPTVYADAHIGHTMGPVLFDAVARWLTARGYRVRFVNNITDIDDKIIDRARASGESWQAITQRYTAQYLDLLATLGVETITAHPQCSNHIDHMIPFIGELVEHDIAYRAEDGIYFDVSRHQGYGKLSGRHLDELQAGARIERRSDLRNPQDFCLWKLAKPGEPSWPSPWGDGRPGWHIECSVMSEQLLGRAFDIHGGGDDLKFPHHENEIAQSEANGRPFARIWMHTGLIQYQGAKISKSDPRMQDAAFAAQFMAKNAIASYGGATLRFLFLQGHYRRPVDFAPDSLRAAGTAYRRLQRLIGDLADDDERLGLDAILARPLAPELAEHRAAFCAAMDEDFNTGQAIARLFSLAALARKSDDQQAEQARHLIRDLGRCIGLFRPGEQQQEQHPDDHLAASLMDLILDLRAQARQAKDYATADTIRDRLKALDITVTDGPKGASWSRDG